MAVQLTIAGQTFEFPTTGEDNWGDQVTLWATAVSTQLLQRTGGNFSLTADVNFGASFGLKSLYYKSRATNVSSSGIVRLGNTEAIGWRNAANSGNVTLSVNSSDVGQFSSALTLAGRLLVPNGTLPLPSLALGVVGTGFGRSTNASGSIIKSSLDGYEVGSVLFSRAPGTNTTRTPTGNTTSGSPVISSISAMTGITVGMVVTGLGLPSTPSDRANVYSISGSTVTLTMNVSSSNTGATYTFSDPGEVAFVLGNNELWANLYSAGSAIYFNASDTYVPQACSIGARYTDSVTYGSDSVDPVGHGGAIQVFARSHATDANKTFFWNQGLKTGQIVSNGGSSCSWTIGVAPADTHTVNGLVTFVDRIAGNLRVGTNAASNLGLYGNNLFFNANGASDTVNTVSTGSATDTLILTGDASDIAGAHGAAIILKSRSNGSNANRTSFQNMGLLSGFIDGVGGVNANWTIGTASTDTHTLNGTLTFTGQVKAKDGSVSSPGVCLTSSTNSGLYYLGSNNIGISVNSTKAIDLKTTGVAILATTTNDSAAAGFYGEYTESAADYAAYGASTGQYSDLATRSLTAGDWEISVSFTVYNANAAGLTSRLIGVSTGTAGNTFSDRLDGNNCLIRDNAIGNSITDSMNIAGFRVSVASTTTVRMKVSLGFGGGTPQIAYKMSARRMR